MQMEHLRLAAAAANRLRLDAVRQAFDATDLESRPTEGQQEFFDDLGSVPTRWIRAANRTGKSQSVAREVAWIFEGTHPTWKKPERWAGPIQLMIVGRTHKIVENELWKKIAAFLEPGSVKIYRAGINLDRAVHLKTGNTILFFSHESEEQARSRTQAFTVQYVWIDEMPGSARLVQELQLRVLTDGGYFVASFTPKVKNDEIRRMVDAAELPNARQYRWKMFDNPIFTKYPELRERVLSELEPFSESYRNTILNGDWYSGDRAVYEFTPQPPMVVAPVSYSPAWRHVHSVDPAVSSKLGYTLWAEDPVSGMWYCIKSRYLEGIYVPALIVAAVEKESAGVNMVERICDPHETWYMSQASHDGVSHIGVPNKGDRKSELIKNLQAALGVDIAIAPWCTELIDEFVTCQWSETVEGRIAGSSRYHLLDAAQYFVDRRPARTVARRAFTLHGQIREINEKAQVAAALERERLVGRRFGGRRSYDPGRLMEIRRRITE
jgi:phage terminase large subunit-like protein